MRANYTNLQEKISATTEYLELFLRNLLLHEKMNCITVICISADFLQPKK